jgi:GntR family histidine utilization transcriptional repressor
LSQVAPLTEGEHVVEAILADPSECRLLHIDLSEPCLLIRRRTWSGRQPVTAARLIHPGSRHRLEGRFGK